MPRFSVEFRELRESDVETSGGNASPEDGGCALLVNGMLVAILDEYGTAFVNTTEIECGGSQPKAQALVEMASQLVMTIHEEYVASQTRVCAYCDVNIEVHPEGGWMSLKTFDEKVCPSNPGEGTFHWPKDLLEPESCDGCGEPFGEYDGRYHKHC